MFSYIFNDWRLPERKPSSLQKEAAEQALCGLWMGSQLPGISKRVRFCKLLKGQKAQVTQATHVLIGRTLERAQMVKKKICLQCRRPGFNPWVWKIPWRREWVPTPVFLPGECHGQRSLKGCSPRGCKWSDMTEQLAPCFRKE